jgi:hypothetical protein
MMAFGEPGGTGWHRFRLWTSPRARTVYYGRGATRATHAHLLPAVFAGTAAPNLAAPLSESKMA